MPAPNSTLAAIRTKVRRLTRTPTLAQMDDTVLDEYINTFIVYDIPEHLRLFNLKRQFTFFTNPYQDVYPTSSDGVMGVVTNPLYNFQNICLTVHDPVYIAGFKSLFSQSREQFFGIYPKINNITSTGYIGTGVPMGTLAGNVNTNLIGTSGTGYVLLQNEVLFSSVDTNNNGLALVDVPVMNPATGNPTTIGNLYIPGNLPAVPPIAVDPNNNINYVTGAYRITFNAGNPKLGAPINSQTVPQITTLPQALLYFDNTFTIRPIPDQPYRVNFEVFMRPTYLLNAGSFPELEEWWQYIAYGAAKKIFEDRMDLDSVQMIAPEYKKQETLCLRRTLVQNANQRTATIYTEQTGMASGGWGWGSGNNV
jgi:hypothetical protein